MTKHLSINIDDFFGAAPLAPAIDTNADNIDLFAQAIAGRFSTSDKTLLTTVLTPSVPTGPSTPRRPPTTLPSAAPMPATPLARMPISHASSSRAPVASSSASPADFSVATAQSVSDILRTPRVLVLDIRPLSAYTAARLPHAISLSVPSTLLKRPAFNLEKLATMLPSAKARSRFEAWSSASRILVYDADSPTLTDGSNLLGLLRKFRLAGFPGDVAWLQGGIQAVWRENRHLVDEKALSEDEEDGNSSEALRTRNLPQAAFQQASTTILHPSPGSMTMPLSESFSHVSQSMQSTGAPSVRIAPANPFFDNIRQNMELSQGITERIPLRLSPSIVSRTQDLPFTWLRRIAKTAGHDEGTEALAMQFYRIELGEQRRLQGIMAHHSLQSGRAEGPDQDDSMSESKNDDRPFPYSIVAGVEKGTKNRYRNIWPFEHSRVRLKDEVSDDYVNASYVQPLGTRRKFIATQGPLPSTFSDFWSVVWQQDVHIILMLTKEYEGGSIKCGKYWADGDYGPYRLKCISVSGAVESGDAGGHASAGGYFNAPPKDGGGVAGTRSPEDRENNFTIRRVFELTSTAQPELPPRTITQLQYLGWPDMDVPVNPRSLLRLMFEVDDMADEDAAKYAHTGKVSPVLLHCSAGVGRTGAFIMIDAALDGVRCEIRKRARAKEEAKSANNSSGSDSDDQSDGDVAMEVDPASFMREQGITPSALVTTPKPFCPSKSTVFPPTPKSMSPKENVLQAGPTATLHIGKSTDQADIHVPLVPSSELPSQQTQSAQAASMSTAGPSPSHHHPHHHQSSPIASSLLKRRMTSRQLMQRSPVKSDFTIADADSMFVSANPNPDFAMDVQPLSKQTRNDNSSSGEGTTSSGDKGSGSASSGSASDGRMTGHLQMAFSNLSSTNLSSTDDNPDPPKRLRRRGVVAGSDGTGSGEGVSGSASESSGRTSSNATGSNSGGYSSTSSLGLGRFAGMEMASPPPSSGSGHSSPAPSRPTVPLANRARHRTPRNLPIQKPSLLAPKPLHLKLQMPELTEGVAMNVQSAPGPLGEMQASSASIRSNLSSSSSFGSSGSSSTDTTSTSTSTSLRSTSLSLSGHTTDTYDTSTSTHNMSSRDQSIEKHAVGARSSLALQSMSDQSAFDCTAPRDLHGDDSPPLLSSLQEPLRQILEDMREQRMSLCQSLRQYVFVHNAIIEGALIVAEQERKQLNVDPREVFDPDSPPPPPPLTTDPSSLKGAVGTIDTASNMMTGKRGASPTELQKEDKKGDVALIKRPSVKRGQSTSGREPTGATSIQV